MAQSHQLQMSRRELKFIISEPTALSVREFVRPYLELDEFCLGKPNLCYYIHSLYLDSDQLDTFWHTINGNKNRYKLRVRFYDDRPNTPVFFEIKSRQNDAILKKRAAVKREAVVPLLHGALPDREFLFSDDPKELGALTTFCRMMNDIQAKPKAQVSYLREAWVSTHDNSVRVTIDRKVQNAPRFTAELSTHIETDGYVFGNDVVLELKYTGRFPDWFKHLVRVHNCMQCGAAKYAMGIENYGKDKYSEVFGPNSRRTFFSS
jgi:hypothetical protein